MELVVFQLLSFNFHSASLLFGDEEDISIEGADEGEELHENEATQQYGDENQQFIDVEEDEEKESKEKIEVRFSSKRSRCK